MIKEFIEQSLKKFPNLVWEEEEKTCNSEEILCMINEISVKIKKISNQRIKCGVLCKSSLNTAIYILTCLKNDKIVIPMSFNYGLDHCKKILELVKPDIILTDEVILCKKIWNDPVNLISDNFIYSVSIEEEVELDDVSFIMCTSGTTGIPKGVMITKKGLLENIFNIGKYFRLTSNDKILIARPLYHMAVMVGEFFVALYRGASIKFYSGKYNPFVIQKMLMDVTALCGTPTLFRQLTKYCEHLGKNYHLSIIATSGECLDYDTAMHMRNIFKTALIYNVYGLTEAGPRVSYLPPEKFDITPQSVGIPLENTQITICDQDMREIPNGNIGMIYVKSDSLMKGYYKNQELTDKTLISGFLKTGDIGYKNNEGYLFVLSRADDMIVKAGMNIYPREIENYIIKYSGVKECIAYGINKNGTQLIGCDIVCEKNKRIKKEELLRAIPEYLRPNILNFVDALKKNASGKIVRPHK